MKNITIINIILVAIALILIINFITPLSVAISTLTGKIAQNLDDSEFSCVFYNNGEQNELPINSCCLETMKQEACIQEDTIGIKCYNSPTSQKYIMLNKKAFYYCQQEGYDVTVG